MSAQPSYAVIIPLYDTQPRYFQECLRSVDSAVQQYAYGDVEVIAIDDGSAENCAVQYRRIVESFVSCGLNLRYLRHDANYGIARTRAAGIESSSADWLVLLDSDDLLAPDVFAKVATIPDSAALAFTAHQKLTEHLNGMIEVRRKGYYFQQLHRFAGTISDPFLHHTFLIHLHIIRRSAYLAVGGFDSAIRYGDEIDFHLRLTSKFNDPNSYHYIDRVLYTYRENPAGVCGNPELYGQLITNIEAILLRHAQARGMTADSCRRFGKELDGAVGYRYFLNERELPKPNDRTATYSAQGSA